MHSALERRRAITRDVANHIVRQAVPDLDRGIDESSASRVHYHKYVTYH